MRRLALDFRHGFPLIACIRGLSILVLIGSFCVGNAQLFSGSQRPMQESSRLNSACVTVDRPAGVISLCIETPQDGSMVSDLVTVEAVLTGPPPDLRRAKLIFSLTGVDVLTDYLSPYTFVLPSDHFPNGLQILSVVAVLNDDTITDSATMTLDIENASRSVSEKETLFVPYTAPQSPPGQPFVVAATGDGASGESTAVPDLIASWEPGMFLYLGDVYENGTYSEFYNWYGSGRNYFSQFKSITNPTVGNHEYTKGEAPGYFEYWNQPPHYYSFDSAGWHFISLDSNLSRQMGPGTAQYEWLARDLAKNTTLCTVAYFHAPRYSIGSEGDTPRLDAIWALLAAQNVGIVLTGHDHNYQRWEPLDGAGNPDPRGIVQMIIGSGGHGIRPFVRSDPRVVRSLDYVEDTAGALRLELYPDGATFNYINVDGAVLDAGEIPCLRATAPVTYYVPSWSNANVRDCPKTTCNRITSLAPGTAVTVLKQVTGQIVSGSTRWFEVSTGSVHGYIHSSVLLEVRQ